MAGRGPEAGTIAADETTEQSARAIADALEYLRGEADAAGLRDVGALIRRASRRARRYSAPPAAEFQPLCEAIAGLPRACRDPLVLRKVYRRSCEQIADDCDVSAATVKTRLVEAFRLLLASAPRAAGQETVETLIER